MAQREQEHTGVAGGLTVGLRPKPDRRKQPRRYVGRESVAFKASMKRLRRAAES